MRVQAAVLVRLDLTDASNEVLSRNLYWVTRSDADGRRIEAMAPQPVAISARGRLDDGELVEFVRLTNRGHAPVLQAKLTLVDAKGERLLPAYYLDNYVALLPGETRDIEIRNAAGVPAWIGLRGWNVEPVTVQATRERPRTGPVDPRTSK